MKVLLVGNYVQLRQQSMQKFAELMRRGLEQHGQEVRLVRPPVVLGRVIPGDTGLAKWIGYVDRFVIFPFILKWKARWAEVVHVCDQANAMYLLQLNRPKVITCHDLFAVRSARGEIDENRTGWTGRLLQKWVLSSLRSAPNVVCVSRQTAKELREISGLAEERVKVADLALNFPYSRIPTHQAEAVLTGLGLPSGAQFFVHVGSNTWYKNRLGALKIFNELRKLPAFAEHLFVMAGQPFSNEMREFVGQEGLSSCVIERTGASDEQLRALYSTAAALLFPSLQEGFGWPIVEAQACGCLVITTNKAPMTEVSGGAAILISPEDAVQAAALIAQAWDSRHEIAGRGLMNAGRFSLEEMVSQYVATYESAAQSAERICAG